MIYEIGAYLQHIFDTATALAWWKIIMSFVLWIASFFFGDLYADALIATVMLMAIDFATGIVASYIEQKPITSRRAGNSVLKGTVYLSAISAAYFTDQAVPGSFVQSTMIAFVASTEFISVLENVGRMGFSTPKKILNQLRDQYGS